MIVALALWGCHADDGTHPGDKDGTTPTDETGDTGDTTTVTGTTPTPDACEVPLTLAPEVPGVLPLHGTRFVASGGSGDVRFTLTVDASGALLDEVGGQYVAGATGGVRDEVRVDDQTCGTSATASVDVLGHLDVHPATALVPPGTSFAISATGGSGSWSCTPKVMFSGSLAGCTWTAGNQAGTDTIEVTDDKTGETATVQYVVDPAVTSMDLWGTRLFLPVDQPFAPTFLAGTQEVDLTPSSAGLDVVDGTLIGRTPGAYTVDAVDHHVPALATVFTVEVVAPRTFTPERDGARSFWGAIATADADGDGDDELIVGNPEVSWRASASGVVHVWSGTPTGAASSPAWSWSAPQEAASTGRSVAVGDIDGDGLVDLAVGSETWDDARGVDTGRVDVFRGLASGLFETEPSWTREGESVGDHLGQGVVVCDVDGDGIDDLVASAWADEEPGSGVSTQGSLTLWLGSPFGLDLVPTAKVHGKMPSGGTFVAMSNGRMGRRLVAGDHDADGRCDVLATAQDANLDGAGNDGVAWWYGADALLTGGDPGRVWSSDDAVDTNVQSGRAAAMADVDGDGADDVLLGGYAADMGGNTRGGVWLFLAADDDGRAATDVLWLREASVTLTGDDDYDGFGMGLTAADLDGDGKAEVVVGGQYDEVDGSGTYSQGAVRVLDGAALAALPPGTTRTADDAWLTIAGADGNDAYGTEVGVGDLDGDGAAELGVLASRDDAEGIEAGAVWTAELDGTTTRLAYPGKPAGARLGDRGTVAVADVDGDLIPDLVAGAPGQPWGTDGEDAGTVYAWGATGVAPRDEIVGLPYQSGTDRLGYAVSSAGDVDGDGIEDLAVVAYQDSRPSSFDTRFANPTECAGSLSTSGVAWILPGSATGVSLDPIFAIYGFGSGDRIEVVAGGFDADGDGFDDVAFASTGDGSEGGFTIAHGRPRDPSGITVICTPEHWLGVSSSSRLGSSLAAVGDLDGDGCDEVAVGADADDLGFSNQGSVRILWGHGAACASASPEVTTLAPLVANTRAGGSVDGGLDVDGDGVPDVVVGAVDFEQEPGADVGAVWMLSGSWLSALQRQPAVTLPADGATTVHELPPTARYAGDQRDLEFATAVALVRDPTRPTRGLVAVGWPLAELGGVPGSGGVLVLGWSGTTFAPNPVSIVGGEAGALLGRGLAGDRRLPLLVVGAPLSDASALDAGAVLPIRF
ncbi:MAG: VCBS repeat-containing protein [Alphaproteobacteria bacterium]|nr:VCBS repeat-containing protein [Alphaproteobacteria bacterium]MCB9696903.1 VCBS repeat-containing protein [Alphaproteobacteria bacterium]